MNSSNPFKLGFSLDAIDKPFRLEIAAGSRPTPGFIHQDARDLEDIEIVCDARDELLGVVGREVVDDLVANHILEHFPYRETTNVLKTWSQLLVRMGTIHLEVPNFEWQIASYYTREIPASEAVYYMFGEQDYPGNFHYAAFDQSLLRERLEESGFVNIDITDIGAVLIANAMKP